MAQADGVVANGTGSAVRSDINNQYAALWSNHSGSTEPSTGKVAYQFWADTNTDTFKIRNSANNAWINLFTLAGGIDVDAASNFNEDVTFTGASANVTWDKSADYLIFNDNAYAAWGSNSDFWITHNGSNTHLRHVDAAAGSLYIDSMNASIYLRAGDGGSSLHNHLICHNDAGVELYYNNSKKFETTPTGADFDVADGEVDIKSTGSGDQYSLRLLNADATSGNTIGIYFAPANNVAGAYIRGKAHDDFTTTAKRDGGLEFGVRFNGNFYEILDINSQGQTDFFSYTNSGSHFLIRNNTTSNTGTMIVATSSRNSTNNSYKLASWGSTTATRFQVLDSGTVQNGNGTYEQISDESLKENIVDAGSQWNDIKNIKIRKFNFKESVDPEKTTMIGVVAQEVELISPKLVSSDISMQGGEEKEYKSFKQSIFYMKAIKALQEAMTKIETLETKVAALEAG